MPELGFTGTQRGMTVAQTVMVGQLLDVIKPGHVHHGDCIGADSQFHGLAKNRGYRIEIHPPDKPEKRAYCKGDILWPEYPYMTRNGHIVKHSEMLIAAPFDDHEITRSGTWATVRMARKKGIPIYIVTQDGRFRTEWV